MFKAKLIENENYYSLRSKQLILMLLLFVPIGVVVNFYSFPTWATLLMIGLYIVSVFLMARNQKQIDSVRGNKSIEIDNEGIKIKSGKGAIEEAITLNKAEKIVLSGEYSMPQETMNDLGQEMIGKPKKNYLIIHQNGQEKQLDFEVDSYFMLNQLNKLIEDWKAKGYKIERN